MLDSILSTELELSLERGRYMGTVLYQTREEVVGSHDADFRKNMS